MDFHHCCEILYKGMSLTDEVNVCLRKYEKKELKQLVIVAGIAPDAMRKVFAIWVLFSAIVGAVVAVAPGLTTQFIGLTLFILVAFTALMFGQSRMSEGWPAIVLDGDDIGVVRDPLKREFVCVNKSLVTDAVPRIINPNKKAVEIQLDVDKLSRQDVKVLNQAVWPRDNKLIGLAHFKRREDVCERIVDICK